MTVITTSRIDYAALRDAGIRAEASNTISHIRIDLPTTELAVASTMLACLQLM
ncbi:MAG: hypothetical protein H5U15_02320 [Roseovarius sp.]|jgi:hypothetical protein|nr:hypothetical protein [Roseovarius sp.]